MCLVFTVLISIPYSTVHYCQYRVQRVLSTRIRTCTLEQEHYVYFSVSLSVWYKLRFFEVLPFMLSSISQVSLQSPRFRPSDSCALTHCAKQIPHHPKSFTTSTKHPQQDTSTVLQAVQGHLCLKSTYGYQSPETVD